MIPTIRLSIVVGLLGLLVLASNAQTQRDPGVTQTHKPLFITRLYTGPDGLTHAEEIEAKFDAKGILKMDGATGAELHRMAPNTAGNWHPGPRRQYVITLSGRGEVEVAGGKKIAVGPGHIDLIEDTTGKGHITRNFEDRVTLWIPLADQSGR
jgi:hypothetical protein